MRRTTQSGEQGTSRFVPIAPRPPTQAVNHPDHPNFDDVEIPDNLIADFRTLEILEAGSQNPSKRTNGKVNYWQLISDLHARDPEGTPSLTFCLLNRAQLQPLYLDPKYSENRAAIREQIVRLWQGSQTCLDLRSRFKLDKTIEFKDGPSLLASHDTPAWNKRNFDTRIFKRTLFPFAMHIFSLRSGNVKDKVTGFACRQFEVQECGNFYHKLDSYMLHCEKHHFKHECQHCHDAFADEKNFKTHLQNSIECATFEKALKAKKEKEKELGQEGKGKRKGNGKGIEVPTRGAAKRREYSGASSIEKVLMSSKAQQHSERDDHVEGSAKFMSSSSYNDAPLVAQGHKIWNGMRIYTRENPISCEELQRLGYSKDTYHIFLHHTDYCVGKKTSELPGIPKVGHRSPVKIWCVRGECKTLHTQGELEGFTSVSTYEDHLRDHA